MEVKADLYPMDNSSTEARL